MKCLIVMFKLFIINRNKVRDQLIKGRQSIKKLKTIQINHREIL
jgi:hypothetical protein